MVGGLSKNVGLHGWSTTENLKCTLTKTPNNSPQKTKLGPQNKKFRISFIFEVYLLFSDFPAESLKANKNWQKRSPILPYSFANKILLILWTSTHSTRSKTHSLYKFSSKHVSSWCQKEHSPKNCILEVLGKQMFVYSCISP